MTGPELKPKSSWPQSWGSFHTPTLPPGLIKRRQRQKYWRGPPFSTYQATLRYADSVHMKTGLKQDLHAALRVLTPKTTDTTFFHWPPVCTAQPLQRGHLQQPETQVEQRMAETHLEPLYSSGLGNSQVERHKLYTWTPLVRLWRAIKDHCQDPKNNFLPIFWLG